MILPQPAAKHQTERYIYQKRIQDLNQDKLSTKLKQEFYEKEFASWENKGRIVQKQKYINQRLAQLRTEAKQQLDQRREKLAYMLASEFDQFKQEIEDMQETPEQVKQKMKERVKHLKEEKEKERKVRINKNISIDKEFADQMLERRFKQNADELRLVNKEYNEMKALAERNVQIMEKQSLLEDKYNQEMIYAELYRRDYEKKKKIEEEKIRIAKQKEAERNKILGFQKELLESKRTEEKQEDALEKQMLKEAWKIEEERNQEKQAQQKKSLQELNLQIHQINEEQELRKAEYKASEKKDDIVMVSGIVEREKMIAYLEAEQREAQEFMIQTQKQNDQELYEIELERLVAIENEKQWSKRQEVWDKEQQARIKLMYEVYDQRSDVVKEKKKIRSYEEQEKADEKDILTQAVRQFEEEQERKRIEEFEKNKGHQQQILSQVDTKQRKTVENFNSKKQQEEDDRLRQEQYDQHVAQEKEKARQLLGNLRKQTPGLNVR